MPKIFETDQCIILAHDEPHHHRENGGHVVVRPKQRYSDRTEMPAELYAEMMRLVRLVGKAVTSVMSKKGISVARINYQDNGNWSYFPAEKKEPHIHIHLYVRSYDEKHPTGDERFRAFPNALVFPYRGDYPEYYESFQSYTEQDCADIRAEIERLLSR